jgi:signal transduction histidine kinase
MVFSLLAEDAAQAIVVEQRDIDARKAAERERQQHAEELAQSKQRLEEFAYTAAHDLRAPVRTISSYAELLRRKIQADPEAAELADFILDGATRMSALIQDLLNFASTGVHEPTQPVDLGGAVERAMRDLDAAIKESGAKVTIDPLPVVQGSEIHLIRLFQNLIENALKYHRDCPIEIRVFAERDGPNWLVRVKDNGIGIAQKDQARVFTPFVRLADNDVAGTGLGLAACKSVVEGMGGTIWIESVPGVGSTICFTIAAEQEGSANAKALGA